MAWKATNQANGDSSPALSQRMYEISSFSCGKILSNSLMKCKGFVSPLKSLVWFVRTIVLQNWPHVPLRTQLWAILNLQVSRFADFCLGADCVHVFVLLLFSVSLPLLMLHLLCGG